MRVFLNARWTNLILLNYRVPPDRLRRYLPPGLELDTRNGHAHVSLVAFQFTHTKVKGISWPGYTRFNEINLRFYVREGERRGVVFVRELVPKRLVAWIAKAIYNEPYQVARIDDAVERTEHSMHARYRLGLGGRSFAIEVSAGPTSFLAAENSEEHFFKEHQWGYGTSRRGELRRYEVSHPMWKVYPIESFRLEWDWAFVYGNDWAFLQGVPPCSSVLAEGSEISVSPLR